MARDTSSGNYLSVNNATFAMALGFTAGGFLNPDVGNGCLVAMYGGGSNWILYQYTNGIYYYNGAWSPVQGATATVGKRSHICTVYRGPGSQGIIDGVQAGTYDVGSNVSNSGTTQVGRRPDGADPFDGKICEVAVWAATLSEAEYRGIGRGISPLVTRPLSLRAYWPLWGTCAPEIDLSKAKAHIAIVGTVPAIRHFGGSPMAL